MSMWTQYWKSNVKSQYGEQSIKYWRISIGISTWNWLWSICCIHNDIDARTNGDNFSGGYDTSIENDSTSSDANNINDTLNRDTYIFENGDDINGPYESIVYGDDIVHGDDVLHGSKVYIHEE